MSPCTDPTDPANMTPEERIAEVAAILAEGIRRLRQRGVAAAVSGDGSMAGNPQESGQNGLDGCTRTSPHGHRG